MRLIGLLFLMLLSYNCCPQGSSWTWEFSKKYANSWDIFSKGKVLFIVTKHTEAKLLGKNYPIYSIKDCNGKTRACVEEIQGRIVFLDDSLCYIPATSYLKNGKALNSDMSKVVEVILKDSVFTAKGYHPNLKKSLLDKTNGDCVTKPISLYKAAYMNKSWEYYVVGEKIMHDDHYVGKFVADGTRFENGYYVSTNYLTDTLGNDIGFVDVYPVVDGKKRIELIFKSDKRHVTFYVHPLDERYHYEPCKELAKVGHLQYKTKKQDGKYNQKTKNEKTSTTYTNGNDPDAKVENNNEYITKTSEDLAKLRLDFSTKKDYENAAKVKAEQDQRKAEQDKINALQKEMDEKAKAENFSEAAKAKKEMQELKDITKRKESLRKEIQAAAKDHDFEKAAKLKKELEGLY